MLKFDTHYFGHAKQGYNNAWWPDIAGLELPRALAKKAGALLREIEYPCEEWPHGYGLDSEWIVGKEFNPGNVNLAYVALGLNPEVKPAKFTYAMVSDTWHDDVKAKWLHQSEIDIIFCLNNDNPPWLSDLCPVVLPSGYCVPKEPFKENQRMAISALGTYGECYPGRTALMHWLDENYSGAFTATKSGSLPEAQYLDIITNSLYCVTGPVFDKHPILKYYQALASSACLVTTDSPELRAAGFNEDMCIIIDWDGKHLGKIPDLQELHKTGEADRIRLNGWNWVREHHSLERYSDIILNHSTHLRT